MTSQLRSIEFARAARLIFGLDRGDLNEINLAIQAAHLDEPEHSMLCTLATLDIEALVDDHERRRHDPVWLELLDSQRDHGYPMWDAPADFDDFVDLMTQLSHSWSQYGDLLSPRDEWLTAWWLCLRERFLAAGEQSAVEDAHPVNLDVETFPPTDAETPR